MATKRYYEMLGCKQTDSEDTLRKAYRQLAKKYHPDLNPGDKVAEAKMREIGEAWEILGNADKRKQYDLEISGAAKQGPFVTSTAPRSNRPMTQEDFHRMSQSFNDIFSADSIKSTGTRSKPNPANPMDTTAAFEQFMGIKKGK